MDPETIKRLLVEELEDAHVEVDGDGHHFQALIVTPEFEGLTRIKQQRRVNEVLRAYIDSNSLHAISMQTRTPGEWRAETSG